MGIPAARRGGARSVSRNLLEPGLAVAVGRGWLCAGLCESRPILLRPPRLVGRLQTPAPQPALLRGLANSGRAAAGLATAGDRPPTERHSTRHESSALGEWQA